MIVVILLAQKNYPTLREYLQVPEILEHHEENTGSSLDSSINAKKDPSHGIKYVETRIF